MRLELAQQIVREDAVLEVGEVGPAIAEPLVVAVRSPIRIDQKQRQHVLRMVKLQNKWQKNLFFFLKFFHHFFSFFSLTA